MIDWNNICLILPLPLLMQYIELSSTILTLSKKVGEGSIITHQVPTKTMEERHFTGIFTSRPFLKVAGGIALGSVAVSAVSADALPYISVAIKASFLKLGMCNICKNNIAKMFLDFFKILNCSFDRRFLNFW